jgi:hypothetical protein
MKKFNSFTYFAVFLQLFFFSKKQQQIQKVQNAFVRTTLVLKRLFKNIGGINTYVL